MKLFAIDIGNTNIKCGIIENGTIANIWRYETKAASAVSNEVADKAGNLPVALCSVVPWAAQEIEKSLKQDITRIAVESQNIIKGLYLDCGADRVADLIAAKSLYSQGKNAIVIGLGTATVLTAVAADGQFKGGFITLGLGSTTQALISRIPQLPEVPMDFSTPPKLTFDTISSMVNGTLLAQAGAIDHWIDYAKKELVGPTVTVASGGWSETLAKHTKFIDHVDPLLTLKGTYLIAEAILQPFCAT